MIPIILIVRILIGSIAIITNSSHLYVYYNNTVQKVERVLIIPYEETLYIKVVQE